MSLRSLPRPITAKTIAGRDARRALFDAKTQERAGQRVTVIGLGALPITQTAYIPYIVEKGESMLGRFEERVLLTLVNAKGEATTTEIYEALADKLGRVSLGAIYTTLDRMGEKKFVTRRKGEPLPEKGGKARFYYKITTGGRSALIETQNIQQALSGWPSKSIARFTAS
jgi:PadR family transcriptional regulator, regulatory protein PadR